MSNDPASDSTARHEAAALSELPPDELLRYGLELGLELEDDAPAGELARRIRQHQALLIELGRDALLDIIVWSRRPVRRSAGIEELAREIARIQQTNYESLPKHGLVALAKLREIGASESDDARVLIDRLRSRHGFWKGIGRKRRRLLGSLFTKLLHGDQAGEDTEYRFLPDDQDDPTEAARDSLKRQIEEHGVVGGLKTHIRGAADDYLRVKMDEIETRIDRKLDEIDHRLGEWRDREVSNRLKILRITLIFTVLVAVLSLGYNLLKTRLTADPPPAGGQPAARTLAPS